MRNIGAELIEKKMRAGWRRQETTRQGQASGGGLESAFAKVFGRAAGSAADNNCLLAAVLETPLGPMLATASDDAVCQLEFADPSNLAPRKAEMQRRFGLPVVPGDNAVMKRLRGELKEFFRGERRRFRVPLMIRGTRFQQDVWRKLQCIPYGETASYEDIAKRISRPRAVRAVARANATNRLCLLVPCHRVIAKNGALSGYSAGVWRKELLLELEQTGRRSSRRASPKRTAR